MSKALFFFLAALALCLPAKELLEIQGDYLLYSYDFNYVFGQGNIRIQCKDWSIEAGTVEIDVDRRVARAGRNCRVAQISAVATQPEFRRKGLARAARVSARWQPKMSSRPKSGPRN
mgnify:CR=1 FL=1